MFVRLVQNGVENSLHDRTWDVRYAGIHKSPPEDGKVRHYLTLDFSTGTDITVDLCEGDQVFYMNEQGKTFDKSIIRP